MKPSVIERPILLGVENFSSEVYWFQNSSVGYQNQKVPKEYALNQGVLKEELGNLRKKGKSGKSLEI